VNTIYACPTCDARSLGERLERLRRRKPIDLLDEGEGMSSVHGFEELGPEAGDFPWSEREFAARARATRREVRNLLQDQTFLAGIGNAYADEILWEAQLHPKRRVATLSDEEMSRFYRALKDVIARGVRKVEEHLPPELGTKIRDHMKVRGHKGKPCPRCGTAIIKTRHGLDDMYLCPRCQPPPKGQLR
jgi:formamidopyrimidine-DNA glycosylase